MLPKQIYVYIVNGNNNNKKIKSGNGYIVVCTIFFLSGLEK